MVHSDGAGEAGTPACPSLHQGVAAQTQPCLRRYPMIELVAMSCKAGQAVQREGAEELTPRGHASSHCWAVTSVCSLPAASNCTTLCIRVSLPEGCSGRRNAERRPTHPQRQTWLRPDSSLRIGNTGDRGVVRSNSRCKLLKPAIENRARSDQGS